VTIAVPPAGLPPRRTPFAHASEAELARILDFYEVRWQYEPDTFPIGWSLDGDVVESFAPDFYLPDLELYVELTTLKQKLVRKKNRKLRRLRELYPDVRIKLFYARDFRALLLKFGRLALVDELSGTTGQATPPRLHAAPIEHDATPVAIAHGPDEDAPDDADGPDDHEAELPAGHPASPTRANSLRGRRRGRRRRAAARAARSAVETADAGTLPA
jgi:hypothetical protein